MATGLIRRDTHKMATRQELINDITIAIGNDMKFANTIQDEDDAWSEGMQAQLRRTPKEELIRLAEEARV